MERLETVLMEKFQEYVVNHNPELVLGRRDIYPASRMIRERVNFVLPTLKFLQDERKSDQQILEKCMEILTRDLKPSKADYIREVIRTEFPAEYAELCERGELTGTTLRLMALCHDIFQAFGFTEQNKDSLKLRHAVIAEISAGLRAQGLRR